jgi:predicted Ser/Thr protein kinase/tetratricopeptide (TPR) repeat protein
MTKIGKYEILEELGRGGMGVVYKGYDALMEREVALKVISDSVLAVPEIRSRFYREARTAGKLSHENITVIYEVGEDEGRPYIAMEYLTGADLGTLLEKGEQISFAQKLDYAIQICRGLSFSHSHGIVHRDIKPANIRIAGRGKVKIMDFGIAKPESSSLTRTGAIIGTPFYMSPEQIQGRKIDTRSDIFSFGVLFFELLTGKKPFSGDESTAVMYKIVYDEPEPIDGSEIGHHKGLRQVILKLLAKNPDKRYQDLAEVAGILEGVLAETKSAEWKKTEERTIKVEKALADARDYIRSGKFKKAQEAIERGERLDPAYPDLAMARGELKAAEEQARRRALIDERLAAARALAAARKHQQVIETLREVLAIDPGETEALGMIRDAQDAITYAKSGDVRFAETRMASPPPPLTPPPMKGPRPAAAPPRATPLSPEKRRVVLGIAGIILVAAAIVAYRFFLYVPPVPVGYVALNILPYAQITRIVGTNGQEVRLPSTTTTPCRLALPEGSYDIHMVNPAYPKPLIVNVKVRNAETQDVKQKFVGFEYQQFLSRLK